MKVKSQNNLKNIYESNKPFKVLSSCFYFVIFLHILVFILRHAGKGVNGFQHTNDCLFNGEFLWSRRPTHTWQVKNFSWKSLGHFYPISIEFSILSLPGNQAIKTQSHTHVYGRHKWGDPDPLSKNNGRNSKLDITFFETLSICWHFLELWHPCPRLLGHCVSPLTENNDVTSTLSYLSARHTFSWHQPPPGSALLGFDQSLHPQPLHDLQSLSGWCLLQN